MDTKNPSKRNFNVNSRKLTCNLTMNVSEACSQIIQPNEKGHVCKAVNHFLVVLHRIS
uniref:Uncharacterized protein n=1 Tax=Arundo donax TaxID=35708 RepID=A0A0A9HJF2_ARUDO